MAKKKGKRKTQKPKLNQVWIFVSIIIVIAIVSMTISYFYVNEEKPDVLLLPTQEEQTESMPETNQAIPATLQGTWVSNYDGAMLTITGEQFSLEISGVDLGQIILGNLAIEGNIITFVYDSGTDMCIGPEGHYLYSFDEDDEIFFKLIKDICEGRKERMSATWFKI